jgi:hypothetical protein
MLNLAEIERKMLQANDALTTDAQGAETLRGLTVDESQFVLAVERTADQNVGAAESTAYRQLRNLHTASRQMNALQLRARRSKDSDK